MKKDPIPDSQGFKPTAQDLSTFEGKPRFYRLSGPGALIRLVQFARTDHMGQELGPSSFFSKCWFAERDYQVLRTEAIGHLNAEGGPGSAETWKVGLSMKFPLRDKFAVSQDWNLFDAYITFSFGPRESVIALVGKACAQPYYSANDPRHDSTDVKLPGMGEQYLVDFQFPANSHLTSRIRGPFYIGTHVKQAKR